MVDFKLEDFTNRINIFPYSAMSPDGTRLAYISNLSGAPQVWVSEFQPTIKKLLYPKPVTTGKNKSPDVINPALKWIDNDQLVVVMDHHGDEKTFIEVINLKTGEVFEIPKGSGRDFLGFVSQDKKRIHFSSNRDNPMLQSLYTFEIKSKKIECIYLASEKSASWLIKEPINGSYFFSLSASNTANDLKMVNLKTKVVVDVFCDKNTLIDPITVLNKTKIVVATNNQRQFMSLATLDLKTRKIEYHTKDQWDVETAEVSADGKNLFLARNVEGKSHLEHYQLPSFKRKPILFKKEGVIASLCHLKKSNRLVVAYSSTTEPRNFYQLHLSSKKMDRLTDNWTSRIPEKSLCQPKSIWYKSEKGEINSWLFLPARTQKNKSTPVLIWPHGGPQWQERAQFRPIFQYLVMRGFAIWAPNHTGSTGYGIDFTNAINRKWGTADFPDMLHGIEWLKNSGWINPKQIAIAGGSYGGYMTLRSITKIPNTFKVAVDIFGVSNMISFANSVPADWKPYMDQSVGNPEKDFEMLQEQSPIHALDKVDCPLLVIQGALDPRVVKAESDQVVEKLKALKKEVEYLVFEDEGHGFTKPENELKAYQTLAHFIEKHMK